MEKADRRLGKNLWEAHAQEYVRRETQNRLAVRAYLHNDEVGLGQDQEDAMGFNETRNVNGFPFTFA